MNKWILRLTQKTWLFVVTLNSFILLNTSCAVLHRVQISDVEKLSANSKPFSIKVSELTVSLRDLEGLSKVAAMKSKSQGLNSLGRALSYIILAFSWGPITGTPVYTEDYARDINLRLMKICPKGRMTNIVAVRESSEYPVVKGEIVRIDGICVS